MTDFKAKDALIDMSSEAVRAEAVRLKALLHYDLLDTPAEESFDRITRVAQSVMHTPIALMSLIDTTRQWFKSRQGLAVCATGRDISFCTHAILQDRPFIIHDAREDARFKDNPLVTGPPYIRFYLGIPLRTNEGQNIGTLCCIDARPREPEAGQIAALQDLSRLIIDQLELRLIAGTDSLTGAMTRRAFVPAITKEMARARRYAREASLIMLDIDHFKMVNDKFGHPAGDEVLRAVADICKAGLRTNDSFGRLGGEEFAILMPDTGVSGARRAANRLRKAIREVNVEWDFQRINVTASFGVTAAAAADDGKAAPFLARADAALYQAKTAGRDRVVVTEF